MLHYRIMGNHQGSCDELDHADEESEAIRLHGIHQKDCGPNWVVWVEVQSFVDGDLDECYPLQFEHT
jgi:hypothetical protein